MSPTLPAAGRHDTHPDLLQNLAILLLFIDLSVFYARPFDMVFIGYRIPAILLLMLVIAYVCSGQLFSGFRSLVGAALLLLVGWVGFTLPFSIWRSNSIEPFKNLLTSLLYFAIVSGLGYTLRNVKVTMYALAFGGLGAALQSFVWGDSYYGRQILSKGSYRDPNEYALILMMGVPIWCLMSSSGRSPVAKLAPLACIIPIFYVFVRTGSRGSIIGLLAMLLIVFAKASPMKKLAITAATILLIGVGYTVMPDYIRARYLTYFNFKPETVQAGLAQSPDELDQLKADVDSAEGRKLLLLKSIDITLRYPIFGVGPDNFPTAVFEDSKANGEAYAWLVTHNTYTQISSETGIPGLFLFGTMVFLAFRNVQKVLKITKREGLAPEPDIFRTATFLRLLMAGVYTAVFFLSFAYYPLVYILAALSVGLERVTRKHLVTRELVAESPFAAESSRPEMQQARMTVAAPSGISRSHVTAVKPEERPRAARFNRLR